MCPDRRAWWQIPRIVPNGSTSDPAKPIINTVDDGLVGVCMTDERSVLSFMNGLCDTHRQDLLSRPTKFFGKFSFDLKNPWLGRSLALARLSNQPQVADGGFGF